MLKRTAFKRKPRPPSPLKPTLRKSVGGMRRGKRLRVVGKSDTATIKKEIQAVLRQIVMKRDKGCILRMERCGRELEAPGVVWQADHLITRANSATYADSRLVVCVCSGCHFWKKYHKEQYDAMVKEILPAHIVKLWERCEKDSWRPTKKGMYDWQLALTVLRQELAKLQT